METIKSNDCKHPLKLNWDELTHQYKVNKPLDQSGEYVDKKIADEMLTTLEHSVSLLQQVLAFRRTNNMTSGLEFLKSTIYKTTEVIKKAKGMNKNLG